MKPSSPHSNNGRTLEYGLIIAGISVAIIAVIQGLGHKAQPFFATLAAFWNGVSF